VVAEVEVENCLVEAEDDLEEHFWPEGEDDEGVAAPLQSSLSLSLSFEL